MKTAISIVNVIKIRKADTFSAISAINYYSFDAMTFGLELAIDKEGWKWLIGKVLSFIKENMGKLVEKLLQKLENIVVII